MDPASGEVNPSRVSIVIGAGRGIGAATALALASRGDAVVLVDRATDDSRLPYALSTGSDLENATDAARAVAPDPATITSAIADATDQSAIQTVVHDAEQRFGGVDGVIACAGVIGGGVPLWEMPEDQLNAVIGVNLGSAIVAARAGIPALLRRPTPRSGRFVAVASASAWRGLPMLAAYCAAKAGVVSLVRALAMELRGTGVTANSVSPGSTNTPILVESARLYDLPSAGSFAYQQPIERLIDASEVAELIAWLAGPSAGGATGGDHPIDGGLRV